MSRPEVSVVMSVYDAEEHLPAALDSVLGQEDVDLELVVVDDGSTDASGEILREYAARDARVRVLTQENRGLTRALIRACGEVTGRYIARQDADDLSLPGRLARQLELIRSDERVTFVSCWGRIVGPELEELFEVRRPTDPEEATRALLEEMLGPPAHGTALMERDAYEEVGGYREAFYFGQDSDLWLRMAERGRIAYVPEVLYEHRLHPAAIGSVSRPAQEAFGRLGQACRAARARGESEAPFLERAAELSEIVRGRDRTPESRERLGDFFHFLGSSLARTNPEEARRYLRRAIRLRPLRLRSWLRWGMTWLPR